MRILQVLIIGFSLTLASCDNTSITNKTVKPTIPLPEASVFAQQKNCFACHSLYGNMVGPSWTSIAQHYKNNPEVISKLTHKVLDGGAGSFGSANMPPQKNNLTTEESTYLVKWVLSGAPN